MEPTDKQLATLRHMLGLTDLYEASPKPYRNYAAVNVGDPKYAELERLGLVVLYGKIGQYDAYKCTEKGRIAAIDDFRRVRKSRKKRMYHAFLSLKDHVWDLTFREFLVSDQYQEHRYRAKYG
jgi:hypothetical protein